MKHLFNKLSAFLVMLMCMSATVQAEIVHHTVCDPTFSTRGFNTECWENTETNKFYLDANCTNELRGSLLAQAVSYAKMPTSPITSIVGVSHFAGLRENHTLCGYNFNWAAVDDFQGDEYFTSTVEFEVKEDNAANARLVWGIYQHPNATSGDLTVRIYVNDEIVYQDIRDWGNTLNVENLRNVTKGDKVMFAVEPELSTINFQFAFRIAVSLEYTFDCHHEFPAGSNTCSKCGYTLPDIVHHTVCQPTASTLGFTQECWENTETGKFYSNSSCTQELTGAELARAVVYAKLPSSPISGNSQFNVVEFDNTETWGVNLNWAAETTFSNASHPDWSVTPRYAEFTVAGDNVEDARLVWMKNQGNVVNGRYSIKIYVKDAETQVSTEVYSYTQTNNFEGVTIQNLEGLKNGDIVKFEVAQIYAASWHEAAPTFKAALEYTYTVIHHTPCEPTLSSRGFTVECWENTETGEFFFDQERTQAFSSSDYATYIKYPTLPANPVTGSEFFYPGDENWDMYANFNNSERDELRRVDYVIRGDKVSNARIVWTMEGNQSNNARYNVTIRVNGHKIYDIEGEIMSNGDYVVKIPDVKPNDEIRFFFQAYRVSGYDAQLNVRLEYTFECSHEYNAESNVCSKCGTLKGYEEAIHHSVCAPTLSTRGFTRECWEVIETGKIYSNEYCGQELTDADLAKTVVYSKLPASPISRTSEFIQSEHENDWSIDLNWAAVTTFNNAYSGWSSTPRYAEFTAKGDDISNARLVWNRNEMATENGKYTVSIYVNGSQIFSRNQNGGEEFEGVFVQPLPGLKKDDIVKFEVTQNAAASTSEAKPIFKACLEYTYVCQHEYPEGSAICRKCGYEKEHEFIHHTVCQPTLSTRGFTQDCWEDIETHQLYSDEAHTQELTGADLAQTVIYAKLPESPISGTSDFIQSEHENDWSVDFNWAGVTTFEDAKTNLYETPRYVEFTVTNVDICNARLLWNRSHGDVSNGKYTVKIYVNDTETFSVDQNDDKNVEGVFIQPLPGLKQGDVVKFEVKQDAKATSEWDDPDPTFKACLEYNILNVKILTANENPDEPEAYYSTYYDGQKAYTLIDGATAYTATISGNNLLLSPIEDGIIPKGEAVIIRSNSGNITLLPSNSTKEKNEDNRLRGSDTDTTALANCYILSYGQNRLGFCKYAEGSSLAAHNAFLIIQNGAPEFLVMQMCVSEPEDDPSDPSGDITGTKMVVTKKNGKATCFDANNIVKVECTTEKPAINKGTAKANINGNEVDVNWVQLWEDGPKFAEYNVGVTDGKAESYGGYYCWGGSIDQDHMQAYKTGTDALTGDDDTATKLWGSKWRMPTQAEIQALLDNCYVVWTTVNGVNGRRFTGKVAPYNSNSVFLPAAGYRYYSLVGQGDYGYYRSSSPDGSDRAYDLYFSSGHQYVESGYRSYGHSVRAVLKESSSERYVIVTEKNGTVTVFDFDEVQSVTWEMPAPEPEPEPTIGTAKATIGNNEVDVPWVQLWENGPKFAKYNVGVTDGKAESYGGYYCWGGSIDQNPNGAYNTDGSTIYGMIGSIDQDPNGAYNTGSTTLTGTDDTATKLWGDAWRMPTQAELDDLLANCNVEWTTVNDVYGRKFTGKGDYASNSVFLPVAGYYDLGNVENEGVTGKYWSSTPGGLYAYYLQILSVNQFLDYEIRAFGCSVRAVLAE